MKSLAFASLALLSLAAASGAQVNVYNQPMAANGGVLRPSQMWIDPGGANDLDSDAQAWADFEFSQDAVITHVRWWGEAAPALGFELQFFHQDPGTIAVQPDMFAAGTGSFRTEMHTTFVQTPVGNNLYQIDVDLSAPLVLMGNTRYFLSVLGQQPIPFAYWQWAQATSGPHGTFWWQRGLHSYHHLYDSRAFALVGYAQSTAGTAFCFGDGSAGPCPCGNSGPSGRGCINSRNVGALLSTLGSTSVSADDLQLATSAMPTNQSCMTFTSPSSVHGWPFGDGRRCVTGQISRLQVRNSGLDGTALYGPGLVSYASANFIGANHLVAGATFGFQTWYRDPAGPCGASTNVSSGVQVTFTP